MRVISLSAVLLLFLHTVETHACIRNFANKVLRHKTWVPPTAFTALNNCGGSLHNVPGVNTLNKLNQICSSHPRAGSVFDRLAVRRVSIRHFAAVGEETNMADHVLEESRWHSAGGFHWVKLFDRMREGNALFLFEDITESSAAKIIQEILYIDERQNRAEKDLEPIYLHINSNGGSLIHALAIFDLMQQVKTPIVTINTGVASSAASLLLLGPPKGSRKALVGSRISTHVPWGSIAGSPSVLRKETQQIARVKKQVIDIYAQRTGLSVHETERLLSEERFLSPFEARNLGFVDHILPVGKYDVALL